MSARREAERDRAEQALIAELATPLSPEEVALGGSERPVRHRAVTRTLRRDLCPKCMGAGVRAVTQNDRQGFGATAHGCGRCKGTGLVYSAAVRP